MKIYSYGRILLRNLRFHDDKLDPVLLNCHIFMITHYYFENEGGIIFTSIIRVKISKKF